MLFLIGHDDFAFGQSVLEIVAGIKFCRTLKDDVQRLKEPLNNATMMAHLDH
jgi:hypothetical protein